MIVLLEELVKIIILTAMLQIIHVLDDNSNKTRIISIVSIIINFLMLSFDLTVNTYGYIVYYLINIIIIVMLCKECQVGLFSGTCYYIIHPIITSMMLYLNICLDMQFSQLSSYIINLLCALIIAVVHYFKLVRFRGNVFKLYLINGVILLVAVYFGYSLAHSYTLLNTYCYVGLILILIWVGSNYLFCQK